MLVEMKPTCARVTEIFNEKIRKKRKKKKTEKEERKKNTTTKRNESF